MLPRTHTERQYVVHGLGVGAFAEFSADLRDLCTAVARAASERFWRESGARSPAHAYSVLAATYRRRWGSAAALHGARLRLARRSAVLGGPCAPAAGPPGAGFDPARLDHFDHAQVPLTRGPPQGQRTRARGAG